MAPSRSVLHGLGILTAALAAALLAACGSNGSMAESTTPPATTLPVVVLTAPEGATTTVGSGTGGSSVTTTTTPFQVDITVADITVAPAPTVPGETVAPTSAAPTTLGEPTTVCPGNTTLPQGVSTGERIVGDVDGDGRDDTVTAYTGGDNVPHVFLQRGGANASEVAVPLGDATRVSISFEDVDYSLGADVPPPKVIMVIGHGAAGSAMATFLSPDPFSGNGHCLARWTLRNGDPFSFAIDQRGPFSGLLCDGAAGRRYYVLRTATPDGLGMVKVTSREIEHDGIQVKLTSLGDELLFDDVTIQRKYGDIQNCDHPPLFADFPEVPVASTTTIAPSTTITG